MIKAMKRAMIKAMKRAMIKAMIKAMKKAMIKAMKRAMIKAFLTRDRVTKNLLKNNFLLLGVTRPKIGILHHFPTG